MIIVREGVEGCVAITLPHGLRHAAESVCDALGKEYPKATVRVVVNHCLAAEIIRTDRVDTSAVRKLIEALRAHTPSAEPAGTLHERAAVVLGWAPSEAQAFSLRALRDLVRPHDHRLARALDHAIATDGGARAYCCFCSGEVAPSDFVVAPDDHPAHKACVDARAQESDADQKLRDVTACAFRLYPVLALPYLNTETLQAISARVLVSLA